MARAKQSMDGNTAAAHVAYAYTEVSRGTILSILGALIYFVSPVDLIPDYIPIVGYLDDLAVLAVCWKLVEYDVKKYKKWRDENK